MKTWEKNLERGRKLASKGKSALFERVVVLSEVFNDSIFKQDMMKNGKNPGEVLSEVCEDTCCNFPELNQMLKMFPKKEQWASGNLMEMKVALIDSIRSRNGSKVKEADDNGKESKHNGSRTLSWKRKYLALEVKYKVLEERCKQQAKEIQHLQEIIKDAGLGKKSA